MWENDRNFKNTKNQLVLKATKLITFQFWILSWIFCFMLDGTWIFCWVKISLWQKTPKEIFVTTLRNFPQMRRLALHTSETTTKVLNLVQLQDRIVLTRLSLLWSVTSGIVGSVSYLFQKQLRHHFDLSVPKHIALQKMKEDIDVLERHWLIASTKETGRKTKINKNNIS